MNCPASEHVREIDSCLRNCCAGVNRGVESHWEVTLQSGATRPVCARLIEEWLQLDLEPGPAAGETCAWQALEWNARLEGAAKFVLAPGRSWRVRGEIPLDEETSVVPELVATLEGFAQAALLVHGRAPGGSHASACRAATAHGGETIPTLRDVLAGAGWPFTERSDGKFAVDLETRSEFRQAFLATGSDPRMSVELVRWNASAAASRDALAVVLLTASGAVRMARATAETTADGIAARFEVRLASPASPAVLSRGFAALSVACRLCGREAAILSNERIAGRYLALRGFAIA